MKRFLTLVLSLILLVSVIAVPVSAAATTTIALSAKEVTVKQNLVVTITVDAGIEMYSAGFNVNYNSDVLQFDNGTAASGGAGVVTVASGVTGLKKTSFVLNFTAIKSGSSPITVSNCQYVGLEGSEEAISGSSASVTVKDETKSNNANLKSLRIDGGEIKPAFSPEITSYTATIPYNVTVCKAYTRTEDSDAKVSVEGSSEMKVGKNTRTVVVTAPNGNQKKYTIVITREEKKQEASSSSQTSTSSVASSSKQETTSSKEDTASKQAEEALARRTVLINGATYEVLTEIKDVEIPTNFSIAQGTYNQEKVAIAEDPNEKYTLYYLKEKDAKAVISCVFNSEDNSFKEVQTLTIGENIVIVEDFDDSKGAPADTSFASVKVNTVYVNGLIPSDPLLSNFYYLTCYLNGESGYYRYDSEMNILQREPALKFAEQTITEQVTEPEPEASKRNFFERFASLEPTAKTVVIALVLIVIVIIALIVLVIVGSVKARKEEISYFDAISEEGALEQGFVFEDEVVEEETAQPEKEEEF